MKFLIFNVIVFFSLGYLLTSKPNENFKAWFSNSKDRISQISKKEIVSTIKKATSENKPVIKDYAANKNKYEYKDEHNNKELQIKKQSTYDNILEKKVNNPIVKKIKNEKKKIEIKKIIQQVLEEKKLNEKNNLDKKIKNPNIPKKPKLLAQIENFKDSKIKTQNKYMTSQERQNALSEIITDMELYHINNLKD